MQKFVSIVYCTYKQLKEIYKKYTYIFIGIMKVMHTIYVSFFSEYRN